MYIVLDLEWNIFSKSLLKEAGLSTPELAEEIMEIGACFLDDNLNLVDNFARNIKAKYNHEMHEHVAKVTGRDSESLKSGLSFPQAVKEFNEWWQDLAQGEKVLFCTWSNNDVRPWRKNFKKYNLVWPKGMRFFDAQRLFSMYMGKGKQQSSVQTAIGELGIEEEYPLHCAVNDAHYTSLIFKKTLSTLQKKEVLPNDKDKLFDVLYKYSYDVSLNYKEKLQFSNITSVKDLPRLAIDTDWTCPACKQTLLINRDWKMSKGGQKLITHSKCLEHGSVLIKLNCFRSREERDLNNSFQVRGEVKLDAMRAII